MGLMSEMLQPRHEPIENYPFLYPHSERVAPNHEANALFIDEILARFDTQEDRWHGVVTEAAARTLDEVDRLYGRSVDDMGEYYRSNPLAPNSLPAFYHNGVRTRVAVSDTATYMQWANQQAARANEALPYGSPLVVYGTILAAAIDDLVFGKYGRGGDEDASRSLAVQYLQAVGAPEELVTSVDVAIKASTFTEETGEQQFDPSQGAEAEQIGSLVGDLWGAAAPHGGASVIMLAIENGWKAGPPINPKNSPERVLYDLAVHLNWQGNRIEDFFALAQSDDRALEAIANFLISNKKFLLDRHHYPDPRVDVLLARGKLENATLQVLLGSAIKARTLTIEEAFQCTLVYARSHPVAWQYQTSLLLRHPLSSEDIAKILLTSHSPEDLANPVPAEAFFNRYATELATLKRTLD